MLEETMATIILTVGKLAAKIEKIIMLTTLITQALIIKLLLLKTVFCIITDSTIDKDYVADSADDVGLYFNLSPE